MISELWDILISLVMGGSSNYAIRCDLIRVLSENMGYVGETLHDQINSIIENAMEYYNRDIEKKQEINNKILADLIELKNLYLHAFGGVKKEKD